MFLSRTAIDRSIRRLAQPLLFISLALAFGLETAQAQTHTVAFTSARDGNSEIYVVNLDGSGVGRITFHPGADDCPAWSPDGKHIAFLSNRTGLSEIYVMNADGSNVVQRTFNSDSGAPSWSPDGNWLAYSKVSDGSMNVWKVGAWSGSPSLVFSAAGYDAEPDWSHDGQRIALTSDWNMYDFITDIFFVDADGSGLTEFTQGILFDQPHYSAAGWSPDGERLSFATIGPFANPQPIWIWVANQDGSNPYPLVEAGGSRTSWSPDGERIAFTTTTNGIAWIDKDGGPAVDIVSNAWNPDWNPVPAVAGVDLGPSAALTLRVLLNPSRQLVPFAVSRYEPGAFVEIHDVAGRRVGSVALGPRAEIVQWDGQKDGCGPGVYFARAHSAAGPGPAVRFVLLR